MKRSIRGDISLMSLPDLMQWAETGQKSGTLTLTHGSMNKSFYLQDGKIIFVSSQKEGERLGEFFVATGKLTPDVIESALRESRRLGIPFTGHLISERIIERPTLEKVLEQLAETAFSDALAWDSGTFEFIDLLPPLILNGPVQLNTSSVVFHSVKRLDETRRDRGSPEPAAQDIMKDLAGRIADGSIDIPPVPDIMVKIQQIMQRDDYAMQDVVKIIMSDQILTSKILRVVNSSYYSPSREITSLQQAAIYMGLKTIVSIVTVHSLASISQRNAERVRPVLHHSLLCAFIARKIAPALRIDPEEAFVCGLLHDIGKTVLINYLSQRDVPSSAGDRIIAEYHAGAGFMLAAQWHFSDVVKTAIRHHHNPRDAHDHRKTVEAVYLANALAHGEDIAAHPPVCCSNLDFDKIGEIMQDFGAIEETVSAII